MLVLYSDANKERKGREIAPDVSGKRVLYVSTPSLVSHLSYYTLGFDPHVAHTAHNVVAGLLAVFQGYYFNRVGGVVRTQDQVAVRSFDILDRARLIFTHSVYVTFALAEGWRVTKRSQPLWSPSTSSFKRFRKLLLNFRISLTCMLMITARK